MFNLIVLGGFGVGIRQNFGFSGGLDFGFAFIVDWSCLFCFSGCLMALLLLGA